MDENTVPTCRSSLLNKDVTTFKDAMKTYNSIKGKRRASCAVEFWDAIAFTTANDDQKHSVEQQIDEKLSNKELPVDLPYIVVCDPPGTKIGSGGANFLALQELYNLFGERLFKMKVLLIHTGGQSKRLPSHSVLGKLFAVAPMGDPIKRILDVKMAMYQPFLRRMRPGVFVTASDDIETYALETNDLNNWTFDSDGFTALAHPSSIEVGTTHGVYVLPHDAATKSNKTSWSSPCLRVLQKPSYKLMQESGAICKSDGSSTEFVYSDSAYFFSHSVSKKLLNAIEGLNPYACETDAYGDFLQPLGKNSNKSYINAKTSGSVRVKIQKQLYDLLKDVPINVVVLKKSTFYHLGTMREYVTNISENKTFAAETGLKRISFSAFSDSADDNNAPIPENSKKISGILMFSVVTTNSIIGKSAILECCELEMDIEVESGILSNCQLKRSSKKSLLKIPPNTLWHTAAVNVNDRVKYVTIFFNVEDDLKELNDCASLKIFGKDLKGVCSLLRIDKATDLFPDYLNNNNNKKVSLWECKIFPVRSSREGSFLASLSMCKRVLMENPDKDMNRCWLRTPRMSMSDILEYKNISDMLTYQQTLKRKISSLKEDE